MTEQGLVSIMMPAYNAGLYIRKAIASVIAQSYQNWELIIVNDGSEDTTEIIVNGFSDPRIRLINQPNQGEAVARNNALSHARGEFLAFLDADDMFYPDHLLLTIDFLITHPELDGVYTDGYHIDQNDNTLPKLSDRRRGPFTGWLFEQLVRASDVFGPPICVVIRMESVSRSQVTFDPRIVIGPDWDFFTHFSQNASFGNIPKVTCQYRVHETNISLRAKQQVRQESLILCRQKAILLPGFSKCSVETRCYAFYDLLIRLLREHAQRQDSIISWEQFRQLPRLDQSRLLRLMAGHALAMSQPVVYARKWLGRSIVINLFEWRSYILFFLVYVIPEKISKVMYSRYSDEYEQETRSPFAGLSST